MNVMRYVSFKLNSNCQRICRKLFVLTILLQVILDTLGLAHLYGFLDLEAAISDYLREILSIKNVCLIIDTAFLYQLEFLTRVSTIPTDFYKHKIS